MPYAKTTSGYPAEMRALVQDAIDLNARKTLECGTPQKARNLRLRFYAFLGAAKRDAERPPEWMSESDRRDAKEFYKGFMALELRVDGSQFIVQPRDVSEFSNFLRTARTDFPGTDKPPAEGSDADAALARILEKVKK